MRYYAMQTIVGHATNSSWTPDRFRKVAAGPWLESSAGHRLRCGASDAGPTTMTGGHRCAVRVRSRATTGKWIALCDFCAPPCDARCLLVERVGSPWRPEPLRYDKYARPHDIFFCVHRLNGTRWETLRAPPTSPPTWSPGSSCCWWPSWASGPRWPSFASSVSARGPASRAAGRTRPDMRPYPGPYPGDVGSCDRYGTLRADDGYRGYPRCGAVDPPILSSWPAAETDWVGGPRLAP